MNNLLLALAALSLAAWLYLLLGRGSFWLPRELPHAQRPWRWPSVVALVPARNEAECVGRAVASLLAALALITLYVVRAIVVNLISG